MSQPAPGGGAERLDWYMARANAAYYAGHDPFADFTTAPEITQAFGEILGAWAAVTWQAMGAPAEVLLVEAGPGRGTLMADALRLVGRVAPAFGRAIRLHLVDTSPRLRAAQAEALSGSGIVPAWHDRLDDLPDEPFILLANEFLDALPIRQLLRTAGGWLERWVEGDRFVLRDTDLQPVALPGRSVAQGEVLELCEPAMDAVRFLARQLSRQPGAALFLDYGSDRPGTGDTLQALRHGRPSPPLEHPGEADLTAHVDFPLLAHLAREEGAAVHGPDGQGAFLDRLGLFARTERLARGRPPEQVRALVDGAHRLAAPERMGRLFKVLALCHPAMTLPGFDGGGAS